MLDMEEAPADRRVQQKSAAINSPPSLWVLLFVATLALALRLDSLSFLTESLWYEDGWIFLTQANKLGLESLWIPYAGYLHTYPRTVALLTSHVPLVAAPYIFLGAWLISFYSIVFVLRSRASMLGNDVFLITFLVVAIALQPTNGTSFFNLLNSNTFLAVALVFYICIPSDSHPTASDQIFLALSSLTGPYSTFMLPVLAAQLASFRDFPTRKPVYLIVTTGGLIQLIVMMSQTRSAQFPGYSEWIGAILFFLRFGDGHTLSLAAASLFWLITLAYSLKLIRSGEDRTEGVASLHPVFALVSAAGFFLVGVLANGPWIRFHSPMDMGGHYFILPYSLIFLAALVSTRRHRAAQIVVASLISTICGARFLSVEHPDRATSTGLGIHTNLQWIAFTKFQKVKPDLLIPINSALPVYPPFPSVQVTEAAPDVPSNGILLNVPSTANNGSLELRIDNYCNGSRYIGLEVHAWRSRMGYAEVSWGRVGNLDSHGSLRRFYPDKDAVMQFAFYRDPSDDLIRLELTQGVDSSPIVRTMNGPLKPAFANSGFVVARSTVPGGSVKISRALLYCLQ